ncbi:hypothetical protein ABID77_002559 [Variovorax sp. PvP013]|jgi:hypothetical protein
MPHAGEGFPHTAGHGRPVAAPDRTAVSRFAIPSLPAIGFPRRPRGTPAQKLCRTPTATERKSAPTTPLW